MDGRRSTYIGESGKNGHCRIFKHQSKKFEVQKELAFYKHMMQAHPDVYQSSDELEVHFDFVVIKVLNSHFNSLTLFQDRMVLPINCENHHRERGGWKWLISQPKGLGSPEAIP